MLDTGNLRHDHYDTGLVLQRPLPRKVLTPETERSVRYCLEATQQAFEDLAAEMDAVDDHRDALIERAFFLSMDASLMRRVLNTGGCGHG